MMLEVKYYRWQLLSLDCIHQPEVKDVPMN